MDANEIAKLADLESREVLLGKLAGAMLASLSQAVYLLNAPLAQAARLAGALQAKAEQDPSILAGRCRRAGCRGRATAEAAAAEEAPRPTPSDRGTRRGRGRGPHRGRARGAAETHRGHSEAPRPDIPPATAPARGTN